MAADLSETWAHYGAQLRYDDLTPDAVRTLKWLVLDTFATTLAANTLGVGMPQLLAWARASGGAPQATLLGFGERLPAVTAAMLNGGMAHALNFDDTTAEGQGHVGPVTLPPALAAAELAGGASGREFLAAIAAGAELMSRLGVAISRGQERYSEATPQPTQMPGYFAAAMSAGRMLGLPPRLMHSAIGLAFMQASGGRQPVVEGRPAKATYAAFSNQGGMLSALLAKDGLEADGAVFEGKAGFFPTYYGGRFFRPALEEEIGGRFYLTNVGFKPWPTTGVAHRFIEAATRLTAQHALRPSDVQRVTVIGEPHIQTFCEPRGVRTKPSAPVEAEDSIPFAVAKAIVNGNVTLADLQPTAEGLRQPEALRIAQLVDYEVDTSLGRAGILRITTRSGDVLAVRVETPLGHRDKPLSDEQRRRKFLDCARFAARPIAPEALDEVVALVDRLEEVADVRVFTLLLSGRQA